MPRRAREKSETGIYHIMVRGINRQNIFHDNEDRLYYLRLLENIKQEHPFSLLAFCLMNSHVHLLVQETGENISQIMRRLGVAYAFWFNTRYERVGHVYQNRFKSEPVKNINYLFTVLRYIHQNPVKASIVHKEDEYLWSSHRSYMGESYPYITIDTDYILGMFGSTEKSAVQNYREFMLEDHSDQCMDEDEVCKVSDEKLRQEIEKLLEGKPISILRQMKKKERDRILNFLRVKGGTIRQIARITGLGRNKIERAK